MAVTVGSIAPLLNQPARVGHHLRKFCTVTMDNSYATGGEALTPATLGLSKIVLVNGPFVLGFCPIYDYANSKLQVWYVDNNAVADSALIEVPNATDLSTVVFRLEVIGV